jgi:CubicO group peptidase (beta-lactamase class C family)
MKHLRTATAALCVSFLLGFPHARASREAQSAARPDVDRAFADVDRADSPGCAVALYKDGRIEYERGYGMATLEHDVPITPATVFYVGSLSKQFTAMAAALAMQEGRLSLDDPIVRYLPELPAYASRITVRHLIHHTSGLRDYNTLLSIAGRRGDEAFDNATVLRITARQKALNFEPGAEYLYSNTGYTLLATIVERATNTPFADYAAKKIFEPLGMAVTHFHVDESRVVKGRAFAFFRRGEGFALDTPSNERAGAGGVFTNVRDLLRWDENFYSARVGGRSLIDQLQTPGKLNDGHTLSYAWGLQVGKYRGLRVVEHSGSLGGYRAHLMRFPDQHFSLAALCNLATSAPGTRLHRMADGILATAFTEPRPQAPPSDAGAGGAARDPGVPSAPSSAAPATADFAGKYHSDEVDATFTVTMRDGALLLQRDTDAEPTRLEPRAEGAFRFRGMTIRFERDSRERVAALVVDAGRVRGIRFVRRDGELTEERRERF